MRANVVVGFGETLEHSLLNAEVGARRIGCVCFESSVHAFMSAVLLGITRRDALVGDTELKPPNI